MESVTRLISALICFAGMNRRVAILPKKCEIDKKNKNFSYKSTYRDDKGHYYVINMKSVPNTNGAKANVVVTNRSGKKVIAERHNVDVRFSRYLFE